MEASAIHAPGGLGRVTARGRLLRLRTDDQLVALFRMGYDDAFGAIHDRYHQRLFAYTRQMLGGSRSDAEDAMQDVFLRAYGALRQDARPVTLRAWLYRVAHNRCIDHLRRPVPAAAEVYQLSRTPLRDPMDETERREDLRQLVQDVQRLPGQQRSALLMRELEGLSYAELADALRTTIPAVKSLLVRARIGLVEAGEARDTACADIRADLALAHDRGVRISGRSRRHMRDCAGCRDYRRALRTVQEGFGAMVPGGGGPLATLAKLLGIGGASTGAAAGAGAGAGGSAAIVGGAGGSAAVVGGAATATKVVAIVCCAAVVGGGAVEVHERTAAPRAHRAAVRAPAAATARIAAAPARLVAPASSAANPRKPAERVVAPHRAKRPAHRSKARPESAATAPAEPATNVPVQDATPVAAEEAQSGGTMAPDEDSLPEAAPTTDAGGAAAPAPTSPAGPAPAAASSVPAPADSVTAPAAPSAPNVQGAMAAAPPAG